MNRIMVNNEADLKLAKQEIAVMRALANHRNSVTLHDWSISSKGNDIHEILIVMQLYDGGTVLEMMNARLDRGFTEHEVLRIFTAVLLAVTRLHHRTKPIIHRDLKIENIICSQQGVFVETESKQTAAPTKKKLLAPAVVETSIVGRDRPRTGLSPVLPRRGRSPRRPSPNGQSALLTEEEASKQPRGAVRGHQLVGRTQSEFVQGATANRSQDVFGATPFATSNLPANQLQQRSHDNDFDPRAPPSPPPENKGNPPLEEMHQNFPPPPPGFADQEFDDFFIASEEPDVSMATTREHRTRKHPPQPVEGFADLFSSGHPASALPTEVTSDVIPAVDQGIPPVCSPDPFSAPRFVHRTPASSHPRPPSQSENENEDTAAPKTSQPNSRHQRTDSFGLTPFVEQGSKGNRQRCPQR